MGKAKELSPEKIARRKAAEARELERLRKEQAKPKGSGYMIYFIMIITVVYLVDEIASHRGLGDFRAGIRGGVRDGPDGEPGHDWNHHHGVGVSVQAVVRPLRPTDFPRRQHARDGAGNALRGYRDKHTGIFPGRVGDGFFHAP